MGAGASTGGGGGGNDGMDPAEEAADLLKKINNGGMDQAIALEYLVKSTIENSHLKLTDDNHALLKAVIAIAGKSEGHVRVDACCIIRNMSVEKTNKFALCEKSLGLFRALEHVLIEDSGNARVHATCVLQNLATIDENRLLMADSSLKLIEALIYTIEIDEAAAREHACATMWNIVCNKECREIVADPRVFVVLASALNGDHAACRMNAAGALWNFSCIPRGRDMMRHVNADGHKLFEGLVSMLHADHGIGAAKACGTIWNLSLDDRNAYFFAAKDLGLLPLLKRIIKREPAGKLRYYACGSLRSLSRLSMSKEQLFSDQNADLYSAFGSVLKESLAEMCMSHSNIHHHDVHDSRLPTDGEEKVKKERHHDHHEHVSRHKHGQGHHHHHHGHKGSSSTTKHEGDGDEKDHKQHKDHKHQLSEKEKEKEKEDEDAGQHRAHHHSLPHISESMDTLEQICNAIINLSMPPGSKGAHGHREHRDHGPNGSTNSGHTSARDHSVPSSGHNTSRDPYSFSPLEMTMKARMIITDPAHGILSVLSELLHYACSFTIGKAIPTEYIVLYQLIAVTITGLSNTSNTIVIQRLLDSQIHVACVDILKHMFTESRTLILKDMNKTGDIVPEMWTKSDDDDDDDEKEEDVRHYFFAKIGNYLLNFLLNLAKHYYITATVMKHSHYIFPTLMECTWTKDEIIMREELRRKKASKDEHKEFTVKGMLTFQQREAQKFAADAENKRAQQAIEAKVTNYNYAEGIKISLLMALLYGRDNEEHKVIAGKNDIITGSSNITTAASAAAARVLTPPQGDEMDVHITGFEFCHGRLFNVMVNILSAARHILTHHHHSSTTTTTSSTNGGRSGIHNGIGAGLTTSASGTNRSTVVKIHVNTNVTVEHVETDREHIVFRFGSPAFSTFLSGVCSLCCSDYSKDELRESDAQFPMKPCPIEQDPAEDGGSNKRRKAFKKEPVVASLDAFKESDYATMSMLAQIYQLVEKVLHIYVYHHHALSASSNDEYMIMRTAITILLQLSAVHGKHGCLDPTPAIGEYHKQLKYNYAINIPAVLEELLTLLMCDCEASPGTGLSGRPVPNEQTRRNLDCIIQVQMLLSKIQYVVPPAGSQNPNDTHSHILSRHRKSIQHNQPLLEEVVTPTHIMACYYAHAHDPKEQISVHQQQAEMFVTQLRSLGFSVWSLLEGSDICPSLHASLFNEIMNERNVNGVTSYSNLSPLMSSASAPALGSAGRGNSEGVSTAKAKTNDNNNNNNKGTKDDNEDSASNKHAVVERLLEAAVAASTLFIIFISSEFHDSVYNQIECDLIRRFLRTPPGRPQHHHVTAATATGTATAAEDPSFSIRNKPAVLFVSLQENYLRPVPTRPTFDYDWLNSFAAEVNADFNMLQIAAEPTFARRSRSTLSMDGKDSFIASVPETGESKSIEYLRYPTVEDMSDVVTELSYILQQHTHTIMSNKPKVAAEFQQESSVNSSKNGSHKSPRDTTPKGDYEAAWQFITNVNHVVNIDDTMADLSDLGIDDQFDFEPALMTQQNAEQLSKGLKTIYRKDFLALLGYHPAP